MSYYKTTKNSMDAVTIIITTKAGDLLLQRRDNKKEIECPGLKGLISGYLNKEETPHDALIREIGEELSGEGPVLKLSKLRYMGSMYRYDHSREDYYFHACLLEPPRGLTIHEGAGLDVVPYDMALKDGNVAPHHALALARFRPLVELGIHFKEGTYCEYCLEDLIAVTSLHNGKDLESLENGEGFFSGDGDSASRLVHIPDEVRFTAYLNFTPGKVRGNHYHLRKVEYMLILNGKMKIILKQHNKTNRVLSVTCETGQYIRMLPGVVHSMEAIEGETVSAIEFSPQRYAGRDVFKLSK